jgi:hypothetical protein
MLRRFSLSSITASIKNNAKDNSRFENKTVAKEEIDNAIAEIKSLGKQAVEAQNATEGTTNPNTVSNIKTILKLMKKYSSNLYVQRVACHALSNLAMTVVVARYIASNGGFAQIKSALEQFTEDNKLCWLASSALWNMARPPANREIIGQEGVTLMLKVLSIHHNKHEKVTNTAIGALSNLSLCESLKAFICEKQNISLVLDVLSLYSAQRKSVSVMTSGAGLLANLAVSDDHGATLLQNDSLPVILQLLRWKSEDVQDSAAAQSENTLHRNSCAALNNLVTANHFLDKILECNGIETVYTFLKATENQLFHNLLENCLNVLECDPQHPQTTMHMCALHNRGDILKRLIEDASSLDSQLDKMDVDEDSEDSSSNSENLSVGSHIWGNKAQTWTVAELLNQTDANNMTVLQYAALGKNYELVEFLVKCGANASVLNISEDEQESEEQVNHRSSITKAIENAKITIETIANERTEIICDALDYFPTDLCKYMQTFENEIDMLQVAKQF